MDCFELSIPPGCAVLDPQVLRAYSSTGEEVGSGGEGAFVVCHAPYLNQGLALLTSSSAQFLDSLEGMATIRAFSWLHEVSQQNHELVERSQKPFYLMYVIQKWLGLVLDLAVAGVATVVVGVAVSLRNTISPGFTGVSLTQIISFTSYVKMMILFWAQLQTAMAAVERIRDFSQDTDKEDHPESPIEPPASWPAHGNMEFQQLSAKYR